jgi:hypothetical protein
MTIHTYNHSYAGFSASDYQSSSCNSFLLPARHAGKLIINGTGNRRLQSLNVRRYRDLWQQASEICVGGDATAVDLDGHGSARTFIHMRGDPNSISSEVSL